MEQHREYRFERFQVDLVRRRVTVSGQERAIGTRAFDLLVALIRRSHRLVTKEELFALVWPGLVVEENNLAVQIAKLRKLLGPGCITTIAGRGYRLTARPAPVHGSEDTLATLTFPPDAAVPIGRHREARSAYTILSRNRLVTLLGPAGIGKTCLAKWLARAHAWSNGFKPMVVELSPRQGPDAASQAFATIAGIPSADPAQLSDAFARACTPDTLLLIENAECQLDVAARLCADILSRTPVSILVTSRVPMRIEGENILRLAGLPCPAASASFEESVTYGAIELFVERALEHDPSFSLSKDNVAAIADVCRSFDGVPLLIEAAATRLCQVDVREWPRHLAAALDWEVGSVEHESGRRRSLRAEFASSIALLGPSERDCLTRLSSAPGPFTLEEALQLLGAATDEQARWAALDCLGVLVNHSHLMASTTDPPQYYVQNMFRTFLRSEFQT